MTSSSNSYAGSLYHNQARQIASADSLSGIAPELRNIISDNSPSMENIYRIYQRPFQERHQNHMPTTPQTTPPITSISKPETPRTPLALLNEVLLKSKLTAQMEMSEGTGPVHNRVFECKLKVDRNNHHWEADGTGSCKKDAKHDAAMKLLLQMDEKSASLVSYTPQSKPVVKMDVEVDPDVTGNPIGDLNDLCMRSRIPPPEYEEGEHELNPLPQVFTITCRLNAKTAEEGRGPTKKYAKRVAADKVLQKVKLAMQDPALAADLFPESEQEVLCQKLASLSVSSKKAKGQDIVSCGIPATAPVKPPLTLKELVQSLKERSGQKWEKLMGMKAADILKSDQVLILTDVAEEQNIKVEYLDFAPQPDDSKHRALVSVGLNPQVIFMGSGSGIQQSRKAAAAHALEYFRCSCRN